MSPRAYDLIGDVTAPAEIFPRLAALDAMAQTLRSYGYVDAADETDALAAEARAFDAAMQARSNRLRSLWKAIEAAQSPYTPAPDAHRNIAAAAVDYRAVAESGSRRAPDAD